MSNRIGDMSRRDGFATLVESEFLARSRVKMQIDLSKSGLDENDLFCEALPHPPVPMSNPTWVSGAYRIPYWSRDGELLTGMYRDRLFYRDGITEQQLKDARMGKYKGPSSEQAAMAGADARMPYLLPGGQGVVGVICEGEKKTAAALDRFDVHVLGIGGCWNWSDGNNVRGLHNDIMWWVEHWKLERIYIIGDPDITTNQQIAQGYAGLWRRLQARFARTTVRVVSLSDKIDDYLVAHPDYGLRELELEPEIDGLELTMSIRDLVDEYDLVHRANAQGILTVIKNAYNVHALLANHPNWKDGIRYNDDLGIIELYNQPFIDDYNDHQITGIFNKSLHMPDISQKMVMSGVAAVAKEFHYSPTQEDILACGEWDQVERIKDIFGKGRNEQDIQVAKALIVGYVKRVVEPGCFWRIMVILVGPQGVGKTGMARWLAGDERRVSIINPGELKTANKDVIIRLMRAKIALLDDIDSFGDGERGHLKALITQTHTVQRAAYGRADQIYFRSGIMMGTANHREIIPDDPTGNTRFAVVNLQQKQDFQWLNQERKQIIAEARALMEAGWEPSIDWSEMNKYVQKSPIKDKLMEFLEECRKIKPAIMLFHGRSGKRWFKQEAFFTYYGGVGYRPKLWEIREFSARARELGCDSGVKDGSSVDRDKSTGETIKRVWMVTEE